MRENEQIIRLLDLAKNIAFDRGYKKMGTECLLQAMIEEDTTTCHFLLGEYGIDISSIYKKLDDLFLIRKDEGMTSALINIVEKAKKISSNDIGEEHLFLSILNNDCIAKDILIDVGLNIEEAILDVNDIFDYEDELDIVENISRMVEKGEVNPFIGRKEYIKRLEVIINRKTKNNPLLIGEAGVGKTAIVEGLAKYYLETKQNKEILYLDIGLSISGSKYRGDFEKRILDVIEKVQNSDKYILFIDELHNIVGTGSSEGSMDAANLLKPILARNKIKCIGATTSDEYYRIISKDKALSRRFQPIFINEPSIKETLAILKGVRDYYTSFHEIELDENLLEYIVLESERIHVRKFPDKAIDILDEVLSKAKIEKKKRVNKEDIDEAIDLIVGLKNNKHFLSMKYKELKKYAFYKYIHYKRKTLVNILTENEEIKPLIDDIVNGFNMSLESVLEIDLANYNESFSISTLIGSPPGYVGFEGGGILSEHIGKFPNSIIVLKNFNYSQLAIKEMFFNMLEKGILEDRKGRKMRLENSIFIFVEKKKNNLIGFNEREKKDYNKYIDVCLYVDEKEEKESIINRLKSKGYDVSGNENEEVLMELVGNYPQGKYSIDEFGKIICKE